MMGSKIKTFPKGRQSLHDGGEALIDGGQGTMGS